MCVCLCILLTYASWCCHELLFYFFNTKAHFIPIWGWVQHLRRQFVFFGKQCGHVNGLSMCCRFLITVVQPVKTDFWSGVNFFHFLNIKLSFNSTSLMRLSNRSCGEGGVKMLSWKIDGLGEVKMSHLKFRPPIKSQMYFSSSLAELCNPLSSIGIDNNKNNNISRIQHNLRRWSEMRHILLVGSDPFV